MTTTTTQPSLNIPKLTDTNFNAWLVATTSAAKKSLPTNGPLGGLGLLLPAAEYAALNSNQAFVPAVRPANVTNSATTHEQAIYDREQIALATLTSSVFDSLPLATVQACPGYDHTYGTSFIPLPTMMEHVRAKHAWATTHQYHQAKAALLIPFALGTDIDSFLATHVEAHLACARADNPLNDIEKVDACITALGGRSGPFGFTISAFEESTPRLQLRRFEDTPATPANGTQPAMPERVGLARRIREAAPRIDHANSSPAPTTTKGYYGAATAFREEIAAAIRDVLPSMLPATTTATQPTTTTQQQSRRNRTKYCWSHGLCAHTGRECRNPHAGHDVTANAQNRHGGSNKGCKK